MKTTHLYLKRHINTGMLYFGKTTKDPLKYNGSGKYWLKHLRKHGFLIETLWYKSFDVLEELTNFATQYSIEYSIDKNPEYANIRLENGIDGKPVGAPGHLFTEDELDKIRDSSVKRWNDPEYKERLRQSHIKRHIDNPELKDNKSKYMKNVFWTENRRLEFSTKLKGHVGSKKCKGVPKKEGFGEKVSIATKGKKKSDSHKENIKLACKKRSEDINYLEKRSRIVKEKPKKQCIYCSKLMDYMNYSKYHGEKCKLNPLILEDKC